MHNFRNETQLRGYLKSIGKGRVDIQSVETHTGTGVPDLNYCCKGVEGWLELKVIQPPKRKTTVKVELRESQVAWIANRLKFGGRVYVVIGMGEHVFFIKPSIDQLILMQKEQIEVIELQRMSEYIMVVPNGANKDTLVSILSKNPA